MHYLYLRAPLPLAIPLPRPPRPPRVPPLGTARRAGVFVGVGALGGAGSWTKD